MNPVAALDRQWPWYSFMNSYVVEYVVCASVVRGHPSSVSAVE